MSSPSTAANSPPPSKSNAKSSTNATATSSKISISSTQKAQKRAQKAQTTKRVEAPTSLYEGLDAYTRLKSFVPYVVFFVPFVYWLRMDSARIRRSIGISGGPLTALAGL